MAERSRARQFGQSLLAILAGNAAFLALNPHLPPAFQHQTFRVDWGLAVDFLLCLAAFALIRWVDRM
jgi:hypothetical protein